MWYTLHSVRSLMNLSKVSYIYVFCYIYSLTLVYIWAFINDTYFIMHCILSLRFRLYTRSWHKGMSGFHAISQDTELSFCGFYFIDKKFMNGAKFHCPWPWGIPTSYSGVVLKTPVIQACGSALMLLSLKLAHQFDFEFAFHFQHRWFFVSSFIIASFVF